MASTLGLANSDLPQIYQSADRSSLVAQRQFLIAMKCRLALVVAAAFFGVVSVRLGWAPFDVSGVLAATAFLGAMLAEIFLLKRRPERTWYEGRAAAESLKTLSWRYSVCGEPFTAQLSAREADRLFQSRAYDVLADLDNLSLEVPSAATDQVTPGMRAARALSLEERKQLYTQYRIVDQQDWYAAKSRWNREQSSWWSVRLLLIEAAGLVAAIVRATGVVRLDILGVASAVVAAATAWLQTKQHESLGTAYAVASFELASIQSKAPLIEDEQSWGKFVDDAEAAISREHTLWKASRVLPGL